ncbi:MAG: hypothetical protein ACKN82_08070, partial [Pirellula sp.]
MAGKRFGIWPARLVRLLVVLVCLVLAGVLVTKQLANQWLSNPSVLNPSSNHLEDSIGPGVPSEDLPTEVTPVDSHPLDAVLRLAKDSMETHKRSHRNYRATVHKRE